MPDDLTGDFALAAYDFELPEALIAQAPADRRDASRLLVVDRATGSLGDRTFADLPDFLREGDLLVVNDTRVFPARLRGTRPTGGAAELLLVEPRPDGTWEALARPGRKLQPGATIAFGDRLAAEIVGVLDDGRRVVRFHTDEPFWDALDAVGEPPLPPYIRRENGISDTDRERYQTVYARDRGSVAAPTAGLHFTPALFDRLRADGVETASVTLHVGYGTFEPVRVDDLRAHRVAPERAEIPEATAHAIAEAHTRGGRVIAVGTTTTRTLEAAADGRGGVEPGARIADLTITPGYSFRVIDGLITNFHLPQSSLLVLTATFAGRERAMAAYRHAVAEGYRFYSYGDAMLIC